MGGEKICTCQRFSYEGGKAIGWPCTLAFRHPGPCDWELDEEPAPSASGSGTYPALQKRPVRAAAYQSAHDSGEMGRVRADSMVDVEPFTDASSSK